MAINYNEEEFGLQVPNNNQGIMEVADAYTTPTAGDYGFSLIELDRLKRGGYNPGEVSNWENKEDVQSLIRSLEPTAMAISNYDDLFGPKTMTDAYGTTHTLAAANKPDLYTGDLSAKTGQRLRDPFAPLENQFMGPHDPSVFGMNMPNTTFAEAMVDEDRIPGKVQESVPNYQNWFERMMSGAQNKLGGAWDKTKELGARFKEGAGPVFGLASLLANAGNPLNPKSFNYNSDLAAQLNFMDQNYAGSMVNNPSSGLLQYAQGTPLQGQNVMSLFGSNDPVKQLEKQLARRQKTYDNLENQWGNTLTAEELEAKKQNYFDKFLNPTTNWLGKVKADQKVRIDKKNVALALKEKQKEDRKKQQQYKPGDNTINWNPNITGTTAFHPGQGGNYQGGNYGAAPGTPGGWDPGARKDGGRVGYANGGLASLFTRRG